MVALVSEQLAAVPFIHHKLRLQQHSYIALRNPFAASCHASKGLLHTHHSLALTMGLFPYLELYQAVGKMFQLSVSPASLHVCSHVQ